MKFPLNKPHKGHDSTYTIDTAAPDPNRFKGTYAATVKWGRAHPNPMNPFGRKLKCK